MRLFDFWESGNAYKVRLLLALLGQPFERVPLDILKGETRTPRFLALNPNGRVPLLVFDDGRVLAESGAILHYLADGTPWLPRGSWERARVLEWMFFEQYSHEPYIAVLRFWHFAGQLDAHRSELAARERGGYAALSVMEGRLDRESFLANGRPSIADIALFAYTHVAGEGGFDLSGFPAIEAWLARVRAWPGFVPIDAEVGERIDWDPHGPVD